MTTEQATLAADYGRALERLGELRARRVEGVLMRVAERRLEALAAKLGSEAMARIRAGWARRA